MTKNFRKLHGAKKLLITWYKKIINNLVQKNLTCTKKEQMMDVFKNKGKSSELLEITLGLNPSNSN